jgi:hypothetical protein
MNESLDVPKLIASFQAARNYAASSISLEDDQIAPEDKE